MQSSLQNRSTEQPAIHHLPTFFLIGATKSGTSSLYFYLKQHPDIFMSNVKEPGFFSFPPDQEIWDVRNGERQKNARAITDLATYQQLFADATEKARGEATATYLYFPGTAERIRAAVPHAKLIAILRNPVERAYSAYLHHIREGWEPCATFVEALDAEPKRIEEGWSDLYHYQNGGFYYQQLSRFYSQFSAEQIKIFLYEDLVQDPQRVTQEIYDFVGVDPEFTPDTSTRYNISGVPKNPLLHQVHRFLQRSNPFKNVAKHLLSGKMRSSLKREMIARIEAKNLRKPPLEEAAKARLLAAYRDDILALQDLLGRDLSHWLN